MSDRPIPRATYRLQLTKDFGFEQAAELAPYLARLGVSHVYASPYLRAQPGSTHGYDVIDHRELNPELGTPQAFGRMVATFTSHDLGQILDFVPNHMGIAGAGNAYWLDVLEWGRRSHYAHWFDIDWEKDHLRGKVLVPFLGESYRAALYAGDLVLSFDAAEGGFAVWAYGTHKLPISPLHYGHILGTHHPELEKIGDAFAHVSSETDMCAAAGALKRRLASLVYEDREAADALGDALARFRGKKGDAESWRALGNLIADQNWRVADFRAAADEINYRRFFNISELAGIRIELPEVFSQAHSLVFRLIEEGLLDGLRLDHIDGLFDPKGYCLKLRETAPRPIYITAEKILGPNEELRPDWQLDGTTGYEIGALLTGVAVDPRGETSLTDFYRRFSGASASFKDIAREARLFIIATELASDVVRLSRKLADLARSNPRSSDFTEAALKRPLEQVLASFSIYRTYVDWNGPSADDRRAIEEGIRTARQHSPLVDPALFDFIEGMLTTDLARPGSGYSRTEVVRLAMRVQQLTGPIMAKGVEDTAFYRFNRLIALNEVGGAPERFGVGLDVFHAKMSERARLYPNAMTSTSTHDTKRGEDARARLALLAELAPEWVELVPHWSACLRAGNGDMIDPNDEYLFYQMLLGAWPPELLRESSKDDLAILKKRIEAAMLKSVREAKCHTSWATPREAYENAVLALVSRALDSDLFLQSFLPFARRVAELGVHNSLVQTALKLTLPGVPDIYQGAELWDLSLVDPDNRRPPDYERRKALLAQDSGGEFAPLMTAWHDGRIKLRMTHALLELRRAHPELFASGGYVPVRSAGSDRICAFARQHGALTLLVAVQLFPSLGLAEESRLSPPVHAEANHWREIIRERAISPENGRFSAEQLFSDMPVSVLLGSPADS
ncbi:MAG: malto-oligosyltrehalose synthase [Hyphomicrobiales bacterium]